MIEHQYPNKLSIAMICGDEEDNINPCIESFLPVCDEIVINSTSNADNTRRIISSYDDTIKLVCSKWQNNFAEARNTALKNCSYGWVLSVDADDRLDPESVDAILELKKRPLDSIYYFTVINSHNDRGVGSRFLQCRMFPNSDMIYYEYPVHEQVAPSGIRKGLRACKVTDVKIIHTGYQDKATAIAKANRNISIMRSIHEYAKSTYWLSHLGDGYSVIGDYSSAFEYYFMALNINNTAEMYLKCGNARMNRGDSEGAIKYYKLGLEKEPNQIEMNYHLGKCYERNSQFKKAIVQYEKVLKLPEKVGFQVNHFDQCRIYVFHYLLRIYTAFEMNYKAIELVSNLNLLYPKYRVDDD